MRHDTNNLGQPVGFAIANWTPVPLLQGATMEGRFCRLERLDPDLHAAPLYAANTLDAEGRMWTYLPYGPFATLAQYRAWMDRSCRGNDPLFFAIIDKTTNGPVGVASYKLIDPDNGSVEVGHLAYSPLLQRTPVATEAMFLMMERAFSLGYRRYKWCCNALNASSAAAAQRLGLSFEGVFRQAAIVKGRSRDTAWYAAIDTEWPALQAAFLRWLSPDNFDEQGRQKIRLSALTGALLHQRG